MSMRASALRGKSKRRATSKVQRDEQRRCGELGLRRLAFLRLSKVSKVLRATRKVVVDSGELVGGGCCSWSRRQ